MLEGITTNEIIAGAYTDRGGICPMLAAHRAGGRTSLISFARAWDRFAFRGSRVHGARRGHERELLVLRSHLEASLLEEDSPAEEMAAAVAEHRELVRQRDREPQRRDHQRRQRDREPRHGSTRPEPSDRSKELSRRERSAWVRVFRRREVYERALERLQTEGDGLRERELTRPG